MQASHRYILVRLRGYTSRNASGAGTGCNHAACDGTDATQLALSPTLNFLTPSPSSTMMPETSDPGMKGSLGLTWYSPCRRYPTVCVASHVQQGRGGCCPGQSYMSLLHLPTLICR